MANGLMALWLLSTPPLGPPRRWCSERIVRPGMFRIAPAHLSSHRRIAAAPKTRQVARQLHRAIRRRKQLNQQRDSSAGNRRMAVEAKKFLHADRHLRSAL